MPRYDFLNTETNEIEEHMMSYTKLDEFKENNPHLKQQISALNIVGGTGDRVKTDAGFKEVLSKIGEGHPSSPLEAQAHSHRLHGDHRRDDADLEGPFLSRGPVADGEARRQGRAAP